MTLTAAINPVVPLNLIFPLQRVICPQSVQSEKYRIVTHNFTNDDLTNRKTLDVNYYLLYSYLYIITHSIITYCFDFLYTYDIGHYLMGFENLICD